jgi:hypothetical protein
MHHGRLDWPRGCLFVVIECRVRSHHIATLQAALSFAMLGYTVFGRPSPALQLRVQDSARTRHLRIFPLGLQLHNLPRV